MDRPSGLRGLQIQPVYFGPSEANHPILFKFCQYILRGFDFTTKSNRLHLPEITVALTSLGLIGAAYSHFFK